MCFDGAERRSVASASPPSPVKTGQRRNWPTDDQRFIRSRAVDHHVCDACTVQAKHWDALQSGFCMNLGDPRTLDFEFVRRKYFVCIMQMCSTQLPVLHAPCLVHHNLYLCTSKFHLHSSTSQPQLHCNSCVYACNLLVTFAHPTFSAIAMSLYTSTLSPQHSTFTALRLVTHTSQWILVLRSSITSAIIHSYQPSQHGSTTHNQWEQQSQLTRCVDMIRNSGGCSTFFYNLQDHALYWTRKSIAQYAEMALMVSSTLCVLQMI